MKPADKQKLYKLLFEDARATYHDKTKLEIKLLEAIQCCETTEEKKEIMQIIYKNCDTIDEAKDTMKYYKKIFDNIRANIH